MGKVTGFIEVPDMAKKPRKIIYENQEKIHEKIVDFVNSKIRNVNEAYLTGSVARREFGRYVEKYRGEDGSDIDVVVFIPKNEIPKSWKDLKTTRIWWDLYSGGRIEINGIEHRLDLLVVHEGKEEHAKNRLKELGWKLERLK